MSMVLMIMCTSFVWMVMKMDNAYNSKSNKDPNICHKLKPVRPTKLLNDIKTTELHMFKIEIKSAKRMFEEIGYSLDTHEQNFDVATGDLFYANQNDLWIYFNSRYKTYQVGHGLERGKLVDINKSMHVAIIQQLNELGWL